MYEDIVSWLQKKGLNIDHLEKGKIGEECFLINTAKQDPRWMPKYHLYEGYCERSKSGNREDCLLCSDETFNHYDISAKCNGRILEVAIPWEKSRIVDPYNDTLRKKAGFGTDHPSSYYMMFVLPDFIRDFHKLWEEGQIQELVDE